MSLPRSQSCPEPLHDASAPPLLQRDSGADLKAPPALDPSSSTVGLLACTDHAFASAASCGPEPPRDEAVDLQLQQRRDERQVRSLSEATTWPSTLGPRLFCGLPMRLGLGLYIAIAAIAHTVLLVDSVQFLLPGAVPIADLYGPHRLLYFLKCDPEYLYLIDKNRAANGISKDSYTVVRGITLAESIILSFALLSALTCGTVALWKKFYPLWRVYVTFLAFHIAWNLVTSGLMLWAFPKEWSAVYTPAFIILWLGATLVQLYACLCSYAYLLILAQRRDNAALIASMSIASPGDGPTLPI
ncbi:hypothetical protein BC828DRAFT_390513 [Blastocladiella britannica]|nr:hypothetical protein BC828DRAFT_390513 [Blastocladiella britannica]